MKKTPLAVLCCALPLSFVALFSATQVAAAEPGSSGPAMVMAGTVSRGELIYVPVYSRIYYEDSRNTLELASTLAIHNVSPDHSITITKADYYNTAGKLVRKYFEKPLVLDPMQATTVLIERSDKTGGLAANFLVEWRSDEVVNSPLVETVMINASQSLGVSLTSVGKVIRQVPAN